MVQHAPRADVLGWSSPPTTSALVVVPVVAATFLVARADGVGAARTVLVLVGGTALSVELAAWLLRTRAVRAHRWPPGAGSVPALLLVLAPLVAAGLLLLAPLPAAARPAVLLGCLAVVVAQAAAWVPRALTHRATRPTDGAPPARTSPRPPLPEQDRTDAWT